MFAVPVQQIDIGVAVSVQQIGVRCVADRQRQWWLCSWSVGLAAEAPGSVSGLQLERRAATAVIVGALLRSVSAVDPCLQ